MFRPLQDFDHFTPEDLPTLYEYKPQLKSRSFSGLSILMPPVRIEHVEWWAGAKFEDKWQEAADFYHVNLDYLRRGAENILNQDPIMHEGPFTVVTDQNLSECTGYLFYLNGAPLFFYITGIITGKAEES